MKLALRHIGYAIALSIAAPPANAEPPEQIFRTYVRSIKACGGPGSADGPASCNLTFEDKLEIAPAIELNPTSPNSVYVSFGAHFEMGKGDHLCAFSGHGTWSNGKVVLDAAKNPLQPQRRDAACRLALSVSKNTVRVMDPGNKCQPSRCSGSHRINGIVFKNEGRK